MDIAEIRSKRTEVVLEMMELLNNFEDETGTTIRNIDFERAYAIGSNSLIVNINLELKI